MAPLKDSARSYPPALRIDPPDAPVAGTVVLPGSKSITNRALLIAGLARGESVLHNALFCDDSRYLARALNALGVEVRDSERRAEFGVRGAGGPFRAREGNFYLGNAGTSTRFLTAALTLTRGHFTVDGNSRMRERPIGELVRALEELGAVIEAPTGCPPVRIGRPEWVRESGKPGLTPLEGGAILMSGRTSSQFISAILMVAPLARRDVEVVLEGECVSRSYLEITVQVMGHFGGAVSIDDGRADGRTAFRVRAGRGYRGRHYDVEGDASSASYFLAAAAITGGRVRVEGVGRLSVQGDAGFADVLAAMGCHVKKDADVIGLRHGGDPLHGVDVDCRDMPDIVPTLAVVGLFARGRTRIHNVAHLRYKESDRIRSVATELRKLGADVRELDDGLEIREAPLHGAVLETWGDHRLAMAFSLVGLRVQGVEIRDPAVVEKSLPDYFDRLRALGVGVRP